MADDDKTDEQPGGGSSKTKLILMILIAAIILAAAGFGSMYFLMSNSSAPDKTAAVKTGDQQGDGETKSENNTPPDEVKDGQVENESKSSEEATQEGAGAAKSEGTTQSSKPDAKSGDHTHFGETFTFKPFHLNLGNPLENRYIRLGVALEYRSGETQLKELGAKKAQLRDAIISVTSRKTKEFLLSPDGKDQLRLEILNKVNQYMERNVDHVFITDMIIE